MKAANIGSFFFLLHLKKSLLRKFSILLCLFGFILSCNKEKGGKPYLATDSVDIYLSRASSNTPNSIDFNTEAFKILLTLDNDSITRRKIFEIATNYFADGNIVRFKHASDEALRRSIQSKDSNSIAKALRFQAQYYKSLNKNDSAFFLFMEAEKLYKKLGDKVNLGRVLYKKGITQFDAGDYLAADLTMRRAYELLKESNDKQLLYNSLSMTGIIANELSEYETAIDYHTKALKFTRENEFDPILTQEPTSLNNIGGIYQNLKRDSEAIANFNKALQTKDLMRNNPELYATLLDNLAYSKLRLKDFSRILILFNKSLKIRDSLGLTSSVIRSKIHLSEYYTALKDTIQAQRMSLEALDLANEIKSPIDKLVALRQISFVNNKNASAYSKEFMEISDSLQKAERKSRDKFTKIQLQTDEISSEKDKLEQQNRNLLYFFIGTLMIGMLLFVIRMQRAKNRELMLKQAQQKANEDIYNLMISQQNTIEESRTREKKRIARELHDGVLGRLFGARLNLDSLNRQNTEESISKRINYLTELKNIEQDIREISHDLNRENYVLINNFIAILNNLLEEQRSSFNPELSVSIDESIQWDQLENTTKINIYRIIQESLQNINKYASATLIKLEIRQSGESIFLTVVDDGVGFSVNTKKKGIGLQNMVSRAHELNGTFDIRSKKNKGTTVIVSFPVTIA